MPRKWSFCLICQLEKYVLACMQIRTQACKVERTHLLEHTRTYARTYERQFSSSTGLGNTKAAAAAFSQNLHNCIWPSLLFCYLSFQTRTQCILLSIEHSLRQTWNEIFVNPVQKGCKKSLSFDKEHSDTNHDHIKLPHMELYSAK